MHSGPEWIWLFKCDVAFDLRRSTGAANLKNDGYQASRTPVWATADPSPTKTRTRKKPAESNTSHIKKKKTQKKPTDLNIQSYHCIPVRI